MRIPLLLTAALGVGCTIRTHRVEVSRVETGRTSTPEQRAEAPVATAVETDGRTFHVEAVQPRSCRTQVHRTERVVTEVQPKEKGKFWTQAVIAGAATTTAAITATQAEWWTTRGRTNFAVFLVSAPIAIGTGKRTVWAMNDMRGSTQRRTDTTLVDAGTWRACGEAPLAGHAGFQVRPASGGSFTPLAAPFVGGRSADQSVVLVPPRTWSASRWEVKFSSPAQGEFRSVPVAGPRVRAMEAAQAHAAIEQARRDAERRTRQSRRSRTGWERAIARVGRWVEQGVELLDSAVTWVEDNPEAVAQATAIAGGAYLAFSDDPVPRAVRHCLTQEGGAYVASSFVRTAGGGREAQAIADGVGSWLVAAAQRNNLKASSLTREVSLALGIDRLSEEDERLAAMAQVGLFVDCVVEEAR